MKKYREFWIIERCWPNQNSIMDTKPHKGNPCWRRKTESVHHVIEHSAYKKAQAEIDTLKAKLDMAVEALAKYQKYQHGVTAKGSWADQALAKIKTEGEE